MSLNLLRLVTPVALVSAGVAFLLLERKFPYNKGLRAFREEFWSDLLLYGLLQSYLLGLIISGVLEGLDASTGLSKLRLLADVPIWAQAVFFILTHDFVTYLIHRAQHRSPYLWRLHEAHHSCLSVDWLAGIRSHSGEILLYQTAEYLPVVLLGAAPEIPLIKAMANGIYGMFIHSNLDVRLGKWLLVFNGPELHRWHHSGDDERFFGKNLGTKFTIWDRLFGTFQPPGDRKAAVYGPDDPGFPEGWVAQHIYAFRRGVRSS